MVRDEAGVEARLWEKKQMPHGHLLIRCAVEVAIVVSERVPGEVYNGLERDVPVVFGEENLHQDHKKPRLN